MIPSSLLVDQHTLAQFQHMDPVVSRYRELFALLDWQCVPEPQIPASRPGRRPHPKRAYLKALLIKGWEQYDSCTQLRHFLLEHPLLVLEIGFRLHLDEQHPYGFDLERSVLGARCLREKQRTFDQTLLHQLFVQTVHALQGEIPGLGETVAVDVKHIYAWVQANNPRVSMADRYSKDHQPKGDPDCRVGVKSSTNQVQPDGSKKERKEYLWGYGSGLVSALLPEYGDIVLAEYTQPFNETDVTYYHPLYQQLVATLGFRPAM